MIYCFYLLTCLFDGAGELVTTVFWRCQFETIGTENLAGGSSGRLFYKKLVGELPDYARAGILLQPHHLEIKRLGQEKVFGQVRIVDASLGYRLAGISPDDWHLKKALAGGGPLMNLGIYCVQSSRYVLGEEPIAVTAQSGPVIMPDLFREVEENITWQLNFPGGALCTSSSLSNCSIDRFFASADEGYFELSPALSYGPFKGKTSKGILNFPVINQQATMVDDIAKHVLANKPLPVHISGEEG